MTIEELDNRQSRLIRTMRFPLIVLVLFEHSLGFEQAPMHWPLERVDAFPFFSEMISHHLAPLAVCLFFVFSGYLFFHNLSTGDFGWDWIGRKWKSRTRTLLIPYLLWNGLDILSIVLVSKVFALAGVPIHADGVEKLGWGPLYWFVTGPADFPLWYLRDLIIMSLLAPLLYLCIRKAPYPTLIVLVVLYLPMIRIPFLSYRALFFFGMGAWLSIRKINILSLCRRIRIPAAILAGVLILVATAFTGHPSHEWPLRLFFPFGMITLFNLFDGMMDNARFEQRMARLSSTVFFIYAVHEIYILGWTKGLLLRLMGESALAVLFRYLLVPFIVLIICLFLYKVLSKTIPGALAFACGGRTKTYDK